MERWISGLFAALLLVVLMVPGAFAATEAGLVLVATADVKAVGADGASRELKRRSPVFAGERILTGTMGRVQVRFNDGAIVALKPRSELKVDDYVYQGAGGEQKSMLSLVKGGFRTVTGAIGKAHKSDYRVNTPVATIGIRGTFYEAYFDENAGLSLAVWEGGITACNDQGCLDLGLDADHRFGFVPIDGKPQGTDEQPEGIGEEFGEGGKGLGGDATEGGEAGSSALETQEQQVGGDDIAPRYEDLGQFETTDGGLTPPPPSLPPPSLPPSLPPSGIVSAPAPDRGLYPYAGLAIVDSNANPWGTERVLNAEYGRIASSELGADWAMWSSTADGRYLLSGADCGSYPCYPDNPAVVGGIGQGGSVVAWGHWNGDEVRLASEDSADVTIGDALTDPGLFVLGSYISPNDVGATSSLLQFTLLDGGYGNPYLQVMRGGELLNVGYGSGSLRLDLGAGEASGYLSFSAQSGVTSDSFTWYLDYAGRATSSGLDLRLLGGAGASYFQWWRAATEGYSEEALSGSVTGSYFGSGGVLDGIGGVFDVTTASGDGNAQGTFVLGRDVPMKGFALVGNAVPNEWGSASTLTISQGFAAIDTSYLPWYVADASFWSPDAGTGRYFARCTMDCGGLSGSNLLVGPTTGARAVWGSWGSSDLSTFPSFTGGAETQVQNPGVFVMADLVTPTEALAALSGTTSFSLALNGLTVLESGWPTPYSPTSASGAMTLDKVDLTTGVISGNLAWLSVGYADWSLGYSGVLTRNGIKVAIDSSSNVSQYEVSSPVTGQIRIGLAGNASAIDAAVGAFAVQAATGTRVQGVFVLQSSLP